MNKKGSENLCGLPVVHPDSCLPLADVIRMFLTYAHSDACLPLADAILICNPNVKVRRDLKSLCQKGRDYKSRPAIGFRPA